MENNENQTQSEEVSEEVKDKVQPKEEQSVTKQIEKMRKRIDREVGQRKASEDLNSKLKEQVKTLTEKLNSQNQSEKDDGADDKELNEFKKENDSLKAQLVRRDQMDTVAQQFSQAGVIVPKEVLKLVVPSGIDEKKVSENMKALSSFYDEVVKRTKQEFLKGETPSITGSDTKPFDRTKVREISDPVKRVRMIQEHLKDYK
jgi:hypothetical protein|nr:MAG TPA: SH3 domain-containing protein [Caudoviricetes sp.]